MRKNSATMDISEPEGKHLNPNSEQKSTRKSKSKAKSQAAKNSANGSEKIIELLKFDSTMAKKWLQDKEAVLIGTDEVGRGCLAGPVVAAAVNLNRMRSNSVLAKALSKLNDSKQLSAKNRQEISAILRENCCYAIGEASVEEIDKINILQASFLAMRRAMEQLGLPDSAIVLVDGKQKISHFALRQIPVIGGDGVSASIAAASVIAKVHRDELMCSLHSEFPHYAWNSNKGYGSKTHRDAICEHGLSSWHRKSFCSRIVQEQQSP